MARILIAGINYAPENIGTGKYTSEMAAWLAAQGHHVRVVTAPPYYPAWKVSPNHRKWWWSREEIEHVEVLRCPIWVPSKPNGLTRMLHLASFGLTSLPALIISTAFRPDLVINIAPTLASAPGALLAARLCKARSWLHVQDFELDAALEMGILNGGIARKVLLKFEHTIISAFSRVSTISHMMLQRTQTKGVQADRSIFFPNWADIENIQPLTSPSPYRTELGIPAEAVVALYSGNMGMKQGLEILGEVAHLTSDIEGLHFVFGGQGPGRDALEASCKALPNVHFLELQPTERLNDWLGLADIHLLPQRADVADLVMPSKMTGMLASGRPILATALPGTGVSNALVKSGICVPPGSSGDMEVALRELTSSPKLRNRLGSAARAQAQETLGRESILQKFNRDILSLIERDTLTQDTRKTEQK
ncbi:glycosyltransferase WbuB [Stenotrophomonas maltophilia]|uniref:glycosyltransferase WbuB n=1 Tax=Stenotrophomonas maltophilia TaxID=40324 RepID=UPI0013D956EE|nr:glycosyltransferase WbuB [Stenotrophomonas maltophilia]